MEFEREIERLLPGLRRHVARFVGFDDPFLDDVVQDSCVLAYVHLHTFAAERGAFSTWLYRIATNCALQHIKRSRRTVQIDFDVADETEETQDEHTLEDVQLAVDKCEYLNDPLRRRVFDMFMEGRSYSEIAAMTKTNMVFVKNTLHRARKGMGIYNYNKRKSTRTRKKQVTVAPYVYLRGNVYYVHANDGGRCVYVGSAKTLEEALILQKEKGI